MTSRKACNHCGMCCLSTTCQLGQVFFHVSMDDMCPAIEQTGITYQCGLITHTEKYFETLIGQEEWKHKVIKHWLSDILGIGLGCTNDDAGGLSSSIDDADLDDLLLKATEAIGAEA